MANVGKIDYLARAGTLGNMGTISRVGSIGRIVYINRIGTIEFVGTVNQQIRTGTLQRLLYANRVGSMGYVNRVGTIGVMPDLRVGTIGNVGTIGYVKRLGTVGHVGTIPQVGRVGSLGYQTRLGTLGHLGSQPYLGSVNRLAYVLRVGTVGAHAWQMGGSISGSQWDRRHTEAGSTYVGSWVDVSRFRTKTTAVRSSSSGSLFLVVGIAGTGVAGGTGTYYQARLGQGSYNSVSFTEAHRFLKPIVKPGSVGSGKGTLTLMQEFHE